MEDLKKIALAIRNEVLALGEDENRARAALLAVARPVAEAYAGKSRFPDKAFAEFMTYCGFPDARGI